MENYNSLQEEKEPDDLLRENIIRRNKKKIASGADLTGKSMLKKSDLSLVFIGAGIITLIIFFVFLRPSSEADKDIEKSINDQENPPIEETVKVLEQKLTTLEEMLQAINANQANAEGQPKGDMPDIKPYVARIERVETALSVKFDVLTARVDKIDDKLSDIIRDVEKNNRIVNNIKNTTVASLPPKKAEVAREDSPSLENTSKSKSEAKQSETKKPEVVKQKEDVETKSSTKVSSKAQDESKKTTSTPNKTAANTKSNNKSETPDKQKQQKTENSGGSTYHTVAKGDTLYNISKRYSTTVEQLRAMNKMSIQDSIVIGQRIVVKK
ncbi:MAG: LysM peptidoglycan-binding domain-containing protein [Desulfamplus sp.]|nr:LysM peptidoglycan-binding domain-containing protein [Desulfamplus sp.]